MKIIKRADGRTQLSGADAVEQFERAVERYLDCPFYYDSQGAKEE
jgi:hypothetical protein